MAPARVGVSSYCAVGAGGVRRAGCRGSAARVLRVLCPGVAHRLLSQQKLAFNRTLDWVGPSDLWLQLKCCHGNQHDTTGPRQRRAVRKHINPGLPQAPRPRRHAAQGSTAARPS